MAAVELGQLIDGEWTLGRGAPITSTNPAWPAEIVAFGSGASACDVEAAVRAANAASRAWAAATSHDRGAILRRASLLVAQNAIAWGLELTREEGKTLAEGVGEVQRAAQILDYFGTQANNGAGDLYHSPRRGERILVTRRPLGVVAVVTPFNFPIAIPAWKIAPALAYGNSVVWKPAGTVPLLAFRLAQALQEAGLPAGVMNLVVGDRRVGSALAEHPLISGISFTGSTMVGRALAAAGAARGIPVQAEMGGKNAAVVLRDADIELAVDQVLAGAFTSSGQKCTATSRLIVDRSIAVEFGRTLADRADALAMGDPTVEGIHLGPVITAQSRDAIDGAVNAALKQGARQLTQRHRDPDADGYFVAPTVLDCSGVDTSLWSEEVFGPVLAMRVVDSADEAFALVNSSTYGLSAAVFTNDLTLALEAVDSIDVGMLHVNSETAGADPHVPFGGAKGSSLGPKEQGQAAKDFYTHTTTVYLRGGA